MIDGPVEPLWISDPPRDAPGKKPMYADPEELEATDGMSRGMPFLALSESQLDELVAYLIERK